MIDAESNSATRNSTLRKYAAGPVGLAGTWINDNTPLTANQLSVIGVGLVIGSAKLAEYLQDNESTKDKVSTALLVATVLGLAQGSDALDGTVARMQRPEDPEEAKRSKFIGGLVDVVADRIQETELALARARMSYRRGSRFGEYSAYFAALSNYGPSISKTMAEAAGVSVPEMGFGPDILGNRFARAITSTAATALPTYKGKPVGAILDCATAISNLASTKNRFAAWVEAPRQLELRPDLKIDDDTINEARVRRMVLTGVFLGYAVSATIVTHQRLRRAG